MGVKDVAGFHKVSLLGLQVAALQKVRLARILVHDPAAVRDEHGGATRPETFAVPWSAFDRVTRLGREQLSAAIVIQKGSLR